MQEPDRNSPDDPAGVLAHLRTQLAVTRALAEASSLKDALPRVISAVCQTCRWDWGALWVVDEQAQRLRCEFFWHESPAPIPEFESLTRETLFERGVGLPGRVWASGQPAWIADVTDDANFPRRFAAQRAGLHGALGFPVLNGKHLLAVMEFFTREVRPPDDHLLALMAATGEQIGQFMHRRRAEEALLASEARNAAVLETALDGIVSMDHLGRVTEWNPSAQRTFGYTREQAIGREMAELIIPPTLREQHRRGLATYLKTGVGPVIGTRIEITAVRADGGEFPVELAITRVPGSAPPLFTGYIREITQRKRDEEERARLLVSEREARREAESANVMKDEFLATVSHELRTPLTAIVGWTQLLLGTRPDEQELKQGLETVERNARAMSQLVDDVLDVSRIVQGKLRLDVRPVDMAAVVDAAVASVAPAAAGKEIRLERIVNPLAGDVFGDPGRLQQVIWNLLTNAIKFTPKGGRVQLRLERINSHVELTVSDSGEGIEAEFLPHVFQRFRQADSSTRRSHAGLGLGLAIVRHLVEQHGGSIRAFSAGRGTGATFVVTLPISVSRVAAPDAARIHSTAPAASSPGAAGPVTLEGVRVLIVDDDADARRLLRTILSSAGAEVALAASAAEALAAMRSAPPHVLLSDIGMPEQDGYDLIRQVRSLPAGQGGTIPAAALTAFARAEDRRQALLEGFQMHVPKPVEPVELIAIVANLAARTRPGPS